MLVCLAEHCINSCKIDRVKVVPFLDSDTKLFIFISQYWKEKCLWHSFAKHLLPVNKHLTYIFEGVPSFWGYLRWFLRRLFFRSSVGAWQCCNLPALLTALLSTVSAAIVPQHQGKLCMAHWYPGTMISSFIYFTANASLWDWQSCNLSSAVYYPSCISNFSVSCTVVESWGFPTWFCGAAMVLRDQVFPSLAAAAPPQHTLLCCFWDRTMGTAGSGTRGAAFGGCDTLILLPLVPMP